MFAYLGRREQSNKRSGARLSEARTIRARETLKALKAKISKGLPVY